MRLVAFVVAPMFACLISPVWCEAGVADKSEWVVQNIHSDGWVFLGMYGKDGNDLALFAKPNAITETSTKLRSMPVRYEFKKVQGRVGLSDGITVEINCDLKQIHFASATIYENNNLQGASRRANGWDSWRDVVPGSADAGIFSVACGS